MRSLVVGCLLLAGCYRLDALVEPTGPAIELVGAPEQTGSDSGGTVVALPLGIVAGDFLIAAVSSAETNLHIDGWQADGTTPVPCVGLKQSTIHRIATSTDAGGVLDLAPFVGSGTFRVIVAAFSHVAQLGSRLDQVFDKAGSDVPYNVLMPPAEAGQHALVVVYSTGDMNKGLSISDGGRLVAVSSALYAYDVPLVDPVPTSVEVTGHSGICGFIGAQTLIPGP